MKRPKRTRTNLLTSLVLVFPLWLLYEFAVVTLPNVGNGADLLTAALLSLVGHSRAHYLILEVGLLGAFLATVLVLRSRQEFRLRSFLPMLAESAFYALTMGSLILWGMRLLHIAPTLAVVAGQRLPFGPLTWVALSLGAGVNEELVFRLLLLSGLRWLLARGLRAPRWLAITLAFLVSSLVFSAAHHVLGGEPWRLGPFVYRFLAGLLFATLFEVRGFAVAVYTHALYDIYVMLWA